MDVYFFGICYLQYMSNHYVWAVPFFLIKLKPCNCQPMDLLCQRVLTPWDPSLQAFNYFASLLYDPELMWGWHVTRQQSVNMLFDPFGDLCPLDFRTAGDVLFYKCLKRNIKSTWCSTYSNHNISDLLWAKCFHAIFREHMSQVYKITA